MHPVWLIPLLFADAAVGNVGILSVDTPRADLTSLEASLDTSLRRHAGECRLRAETIRALAADTELQELRRRAKAAHANGSAAVQQLELDAALVHFDESAQLYRRSFCEWLEPEHVTRLYEERAMTHYAKRNTAAVVEEFSRALRTHESKQLDPGLFPPDALQMFERARVRVRQMPALAQPKTLAEIARRSGVSWVVAGETRATSDGKVLVLTISDMHANVYSTTLGVEDAASPAMGIAVEQLLLRAGVPPKKTITPDSTFPTAATKPWHQRWYVWAVVAGVVATGTGVGIASAAGNPATPNDNNGGNNNGNDGITVIFNLP